MKVVRFALGAEAARLGLVVGNGLLPLDAHLSTEITDMVSLIRRWDSLRPDLERLQDLQPDIALEEVQLLAPIARPGKIMAIGLNYADHAAEGEQAPPIEQMWFTKPVTAVNDPFASVELPSVSDELDYEAELVIVIGRGGRHITREQAAGSIFGYCAGNDFSVRDWQRLSSQVTIGKSFDTHAPYGPWIVTSDEIDGRALDIASYVNGEQRQLSNTRHFIFDAASMIETLSTAMTLEPGDLIFTGTPAGVGARMNPPHYLKDGDIVRVVIEGIGAIENRVIRERAD